MKGFVETIIVGEPWQETLSEHGIIGLIPMGIHESFAKKCEKCQVFTFIPHSPLEPLTYIMFLNFYIMGASTELVQSLHGRGVRRP